MIRKALCIAVAASLPGAAAAQSTTPLKPTGPWVVAYEDGICLLQRTYGTAERPLTLSFRQVPTMADVRLFLLDSAASQPSGDVAIGLGAGPPVKSPLTTYKTRDGRGRYVEATVRRDDLGRAGTSGVISVDAGSSLHYQFAVPAIQKALAQVDSCLADQLAKWGVSPDELSSTASFPRPADEDSMGTGELLLDSQGVTSGGHNLAYVRVDTSGKARDCRVAVPSGNPILDQASCDVLLAEQFKPAKGRDGRPMDSLFAQAFRWRVTE